EPAMAAGTQIGAFHPLVAFADLELAVTALRGATVAIEGDDQLASLLLRMAEAIGAHGVRLAPGTKAAYHAAAVLAAGGFVALLDAIAELGRVAGLDEAGSLAIYGRLSEQTLANARSLGIARALTGPMTRGDVGTLERHLATLRAYAPAVLELYSAAAEREVALAVGRGVLAPEVAATMRASLARGG
ncbi:MAG: ketopantoate reductase PanG, partial [Chloroflexi bacterium]|nr:ketopantoate reductase PanG [Chloroflexota bacterium]